MFGEDGGCAWKRPYQRRQINAKMRNALKTPELVVIAIGIAQIGKIRLRIILMRGDEAGLFTLY